MNVPYYPLFPSDDLMHFKFFSEGPRGRIVKVITYTLIKTRPFVVFNLALGDVERRTRQLTHSSVSDNGDRDKVLMTVAKSVEFFIDRYPGVWIVAHGNTPTRTRLYRMLISNNLDEIQRKFNVYGIKGTNTELFRKNENYDGFIVEAF
ncbi:DUF6934 family protein [Chryseolinea lacunae]|uniref:DUF695 domain-containing protein n=1 Tax=Chryseolinea lacunae TaxID=2801331 RepID=A0ABS1KMM8_9BACT|nr:hypothetical protein [Chryseolinea lacunae]MBL0739912.1 hypothetical protein [Chryseolinea lacunae]